MKEAKVHYAQCEQPTESDNNTYWTKTACGLEYTESPLTDMKEGVTCKKCKKVLEPKPAM